MKSQTVHAKLEDVAEWLVRSAGPAAAGMTGQVIGVDGRPEWA